MDAAYDIPDSTDWLNTPLKDFSSLENALHCQICKEFYDTPMITSCAHTFCSKCIRTSLSTDGRCPACRSTDQASKLRNNWALQEVVSTFLTARPAALEVARKEQALLNEAAKRPGKRKRTILDSDDVVQVEEQKRTTRSKSRRIAASQSSQPENIEIEDSDGDGTFSPETPPDDGLVECPLGCGKRMKIEAVEPHLDRCEDEKKQTSRAKSGTPVSNALLSSRRLPSAQAIAAAASKAQDRISELNYSLLNETKLRKKLDELGIPAWGPKPLLVKRHTAWVNLWNANCDSNRPASKRELLHDLDTWERTQGGRAVNGVGVGSAVMRKDFDGAGWARKNQDDFSRLIAEAKSKKGAPVVVEGERKEKDGGLHVAEGAEDVTANEDESAGSIPPHVVTIPNHISASSTGHVNSLFEDTEPASFQINTQPTLNGESRTTPTVDGHSVFNAVGEEESAIPQNTDPPALPEKNDTGVQRTISMDEHLADKATGVPCDLPSHLSSGTVRKMPMFAMPQVPISDVDAAEGSR